MHAVFMGTPDFAVPSLEMLASRHEISLVVTRPDAVRGRGRRLEPSPVKVAALDRSLPVLETERVTPEVIEAISQAQPDVICVAAYGAILPDALLDVAPYGCLNVHGSLLPHGRGAAPIQRAILEGDDRVGISIMRIVHDLDAGPYCRQASIEVGSKSCPEVMAELAELGACELCAALEDVESGSLAWVEQDASLVTYAAKLDKAELLLDPKSTAQENCRKVQASMDAAPARATVAQKGVRILRACLVDMAMDEGSVFVRKGRVVLGCSEGALELLRVKPDGKREMEATSWAAGLRGTDLTWSRV